ncbi:GGDEF domain-containing protein [Photobacterium sanguinicancri]|uniref:diguanylate cyclase n=1 Tax=Photobacterium sanguinicancri TaxID=875932 RepID=A0AAW7Y3F8_9GAMM|nr:GGDEF domain-containing protein [Photobacterium sanguinicancri]MDO6541828.1 membrane-associated sensor domain-containing protein [Photobacterium sanguinicancri]
MDELSLTARVDKAALTNLSTGFRWASVVSLFFLLMMTFSFRIEDTGIIDDYFDHFFLLAIICSLIFILGANLLNIPFFYLRWKTTSIAYAATFSTCWAAIISLLSIGGDYYDAADILSDIMLMIVLLGFFSYRPALYAGILPILFVSTVLSFVSAKNAFILPTEKLIAACLVVESGRRILYRWFYNNIEKEHENNRLMRKLSDMAARDQLTDIHNRRFFEYELDKQFQRTKRTQSELGLVMIDIDHFKNYNDKLGHVEGDKCIRTVAKVIQQSLKRSTDSVSRYGGEEFVVLLPNTDLAGTLQVVKRIKTNLANKAMVHPDSNTCEWVTVSQGIAQWRQHIGPESLIKEADSYLYKAKQLGRNQYYYSAA